jgi:hypothetical protein
LLKVPNESQGDGVRMWKTLKQVLPSSKSVMEVGGLKVKNKLFTKLSDISEIFNKHFSTIGYKLGQIFGRVIDANQFPLKTTETFRIRLTPVTEKFVYDQLLQLKPNKAVGLDKISTRLLKDGAEVIATTLAKIMNCSFNSKSFPQSWKPLRLRHCLKTVVRTIATIIDPYQYCPPSEKLSNVQRIRNFTITFKYTTSYI